MPFIRERYQAVLRHVADACDAVDRDPEEVLVVAVTKTVGAEAVRQALIAGCNDFGENRVQEFLGKYGLFPTARWHFIGTLQTNKVKDVVGRAVLIHSVDSLHLLREIDKRAEHVGVKQPVLLQVNVSGEETKHGLEPSEVADVLAEAAALEHADVQGLMTMAPLGRPEDARPVFRELRELRDSLRATAPDGVKLSELSMGMTNDFRVAVEEGATIVRVGSAIFGR
ncbi:MAG: YggS family pyridoxal phosphate-dependent enzyme [Coriobacteriia bacterium]